MSGVSDPGVTLFRRRRRRRSRNHRGDPGARVEGDVDHGHAQSNDLPD